jgi:hypothetical protein
MEKSILFFFLETFRSRLQCDVKVFQKKKGMVFSMALHVPHGELFEQGCRVALY